MAPTTRLLYRSLLAGVALLLTLIASSTAEARPHRLEQIPNGTWNGCGNCHLNGSVKTTFGTLVRNTLTGPGTLAQQNVDWAAIYNIDSDGDGFTNGYELGDPTGQWSPGDPDPLQGLSNPGITTSAPGNVPLAGLCQSNDFCGSGHCVKDSPLAGAGLCCDTACDSPCDACGLGGSFGTCTFLAAGSKACSGAAVCDGAGSCKKPDGVACTAGDECLSEACADGTCCDTACDGLCEACNLPELKGVCTPIAPGEDPAEECTDGACNGVGECSGDNGAACNDGDTCATGLCADGVCCDSSCEGSCAACDLPDLEGTCSPLDAGHPGEPACDQGACDGESLECPSGCAGDGDCPDGQVCGDDGDCVPDPTTASTTGAGGAGGAPGGAGGAATGEADPGGGCSVSRGAPAPVGWAGLFAAAALALGRRRSRATR